MRPSEALLLRADCLGEPPDIAVRCRQVVAGGQCAEVIGPEVGPELFEELLLKWNGILRPACLKIRNAEVVPD